MLPIDHATVVTLLAGIEPEPIHTHAVLVADRLYPVKQAYEVVSGDDRLDFNTVKARRFFRRLGFEVRRIGSPHVQTRRS